MPSKYTLPLVYSCSGCSSAAQAANYLALCLDRVGIAEMSCIAGVGGGVKALVRLAQSGRPIIALDGCLLVCTQHCLAKQGIKAEAEIVLHYLGIRKRQHADFDKAQADALLPLIQQHIDTTVQNSTVLKKQRMACDCHPDNIKEHE